MFSLCGFLVSLFEKHLYANLSLIGSLKLTLEPKKSSGLNPAEGDAEGPAESKRLLNCTFGSTKPTLSSSPFPCVFFNGP